MISFLIKPDSSNNDDDFSAGANPFIGTTREQKKSLFSPERL
jgi:hypothetical protein